MAYCTEQDLTARFGADELAQVAPAAGGEGLDGDKIARACEDAAGEIDGYVAAAGLAVPLAPAPRIVVSVAADIARYRLHDDHASEQIAKRYDDAVRFLRAVAVGHVALGAQNLPGPSAEAQFEPGRHVFRGGGF